LRILLDTHAAIWAVAASDRLPAHVLDLISGSEVFISAITLMEIAIKVRLGRSSAPPFSATVAREKFEEAGFQLLDLRPEHALAVETLQLDHGDPFDRLILAQALVEPLRLVTKDRKLAAYGDSIISW
jgi:PIN domain nuclease of toxin-antitoxin system